MFYLIYISFIFRVTLETKVNMDPEEFPDFLVLLVAKANQENKDYLVYLEVLVVMVWTDSKAWQEVMA
jgi:hypothetical protein